MMKTIALMLILAICISFCACGGDEPPVTTGKPETNSIYEKYALLLELLEAGNFDAARQYLDEMELACGGAVKPTEPQPVVPKPTEPPVTTVPAPTEEPWRDVEISTYDDFFDYFKPIQVLDVERNGFGELVQVHLFTHFVLRDGLTVDGQNSNLAIEYGYSFCEYPLIEDPATGEISLGEPIFNGYPNPDTATGDFQMGYCHNGEYTFHLYTAGTFTLSPEDTSLRTVWLDGFTVLRLKGTIRIKGEPTDERFAEEEGNLKG